MKFGTILNAIARLAGRQPNSELLNILVPNSSELFELLKNFSTICENIALVCFYEEHPTVAGLVCLDLSIATGHLFFTMTSGLTEYRADCSTRLDMFRRERHLA